MVLTPDEIAYFKVLKDPVKWAKLEFDWQARDYQEDMLRAMANRKKVVLRLGRRLGKTECMCIAILWHAYTQVNKGDNNQYDILIITPFETQIDLIFKRLHELIDASTTLRNSIKRDIHHRIELGNGTNITGLTAGSKSNTGANNTRGQRADLLILDEVDYMSDNDITNLLNIMNEAPDRIKAVTASTPSGRRASYYKWCVDASISYTPLAKTVEDIEAGVSVAYQCTKNPQGNGWIHFHAPSIVNKELLKYNPDTKRTYLEDIKEELTELRYEQEVMAEFGEDQVGVFQKKHIDNAIELGRQIGARYEDGDFPRRGPRILGVDWDKYGAESTLLGVEFDQTTGLYRPFVRKSIPRTEFTLSNALQMIIELDNEYQFDWIFVDRGYGEMQVEQLKLYGRKNPASGLSHKVVGISFSDKIAVRDPITKVKVKKEIKPFMVNNAVSIFERGGIALNPNDRQFTKQLEDYYVESIGVSGLPKYTDVNEHIVDAMCLALHGFTVKYAEMLKVHSTSRIAGLNHTIGVSTDMVKSRDMQETAKKTPMVAGAVYLGERRPKSGRRGLGSGVPSRARF